MSQRVLICGASGFVGSALVRQAPSQLQLVLGYHTNPPVGCGEALKLDLTNPDDCRRACRGVDWVAHAAGSVGSAASTPVGTMQTLVQQLTLTSQLLHAAWLEGVSRFLLFGSTTGYPEQSGPVEEDSMFEGPPPDCYMGYGWMRRYTELLGQYAQQHSGMQVIVVRPSAVYGPGDRSSHVIPALLAKARQGQDPFEVWGSGDQERDFLYVDDLARACWLALELLPGGRPVNLACDQTVTISQLTKMILDLSGHHPRRLDFRQDRPSQIQRRRFSTERARRELGFEARVGLAEGLKLTWDWLTSTE